MAFRMLEGESVPDGVRRVAREQIEAAIAEISERSLPQPENIHQVRKRCKKLRALVRLVRPCLGAIYGQENARFRDAAQELSPLRDDQSVLDAYDALLARFEGDVARRTFAPVRRGLAQRKRRRARELTDLAQRLDHVGGILEDARKRVETWPIDDTGADTWRGGFEHTYRRARQAMAAAYDSPTPEHFHEWRKGMKYHWYHTRLLQPLWDQALGARAGAGNTLGEMLGAHHDLAVLRATLLEEADDLGGRPPLVGKLVELIGRRRLELETEAKPLGARLFAEKARRIGGRHVRYWDAWQEEQRCRRASAPESIAASA